MIAINVTLPGGEQFSIDSLFVKLISNEHIEDTPTDFELEMSLAEVVPNQGSQRSSTHSRPVLGPGYGLKDWIRFNRRSQDLSGTMGEEKRITPSELAKHCTEEDAWTAINGRVYNMTPYLKYHPGGVGEIMRGAGKDCTSLFNEHHSYVQFTKLLAKCYVGKLVMESSVKKRKQAMSTQPLLTVPGKPTQGRLSLPSLQPSTLNFPKSLTPVSETVVKTEDEDSGVEIPVDTVSIHLRQAGTPDTPDSMLSEEEVDTPCVGSKNGQNHSPKKPRCDWYQTPSTAVLCVYTYSKGVKPSDIMIDINQLEFNGRFLLEDKVYQIIGRLPSPVRKTNIVVERKKVEIVLYKEEVGVSWERLDIAMDANGHFVEKSLGLRKGTLVSCSDVTHNTKLFTFSLPKGSYLNVPTGHHVQLWAELNEEPVVRSYTPVSTLQSTSKGNKDLQCDTIDFMIKLYPDGKMSKILSNLKEGDSLMISDPDGTFDVTTLPTKRQLYLVAAGSGFTPMTKIIRDVVGTESTETEVKLLFANRTEGDILWKEQLNALQDSKSRFTCVNVLSEASSDWTGIRGRINEEILEKHAPEAAHVKSEDVLFCVCGMTKFTSFVNSAIMNLGFSSECIHVFD